MLTNVSDLISLAKFYADQDDVLVDGVTPEPIWLRLANNAYRQVYRRVVRGGLLAPAFQDFSFTASGSAQYDLQADPSDLGPVALVWVAEMIGTVPRELRAAQEVYGRYPPLDTAAGPATWWAAYRGSDGHVSVELWPRPANGSYRVRYVPEPLELVTTAPVGNQTTGVDLPAGTEELVALMMARGAGVKGRSRSTTVEDRIARLEEDLEMAAATEGPPVRVRNRDPHVRRWWRRGQDSADTSPTGPASWLWL